MSTKYNFQFRYYDAKSGNLSYVWLNAVCSISIYRKNNGFTQLAVINVHTTSLATYILYTTNYLTNRLNVHLSNCLWNPEIRYTCIQVNIKCSLLSSQITNQIFDTNVLNSLLSN